MILLKISVDTCIEKCYDGRFDWGGAGQMSGPVASQDRVGTILHASTYQNMALRFH